MLAALGAQLRGHRKQQKVSAVAAAEAAGLSRVTLHRIERGEPSVTMGAYLNVITALGLGLALADPPEAASGGQPVPALPVPAPPVSPVPLPIRIRLVDHPQLQRLAWHLKGVDALSPAEALNLYERHWRHLDPAAMTLQERALLDGLVAASGGGRLLV